ncbi:polyprenyl synthetase family protein [Pseudomonas sp. S60]|uniref:polyprenyl synthetase family protein n=1 Tax=Pseudomonas sp. S60 TaxID=211124 RepID=UPI00191397FF|nr:polyprenyl synthetase family protein [Pseudomonas sp. S60]MBK5011514.1 polyprenyl synthetase family protein [Pseudomonas sp. S60]
MTTTAPTLSAADAGHDHQLAAAHAAIEARLAALLPPAGHERDLVAAAMRDCTLAPGKRLRPILLLFTATGLGACPQAALDLGCAVEMVHAASLVLDDLPCMDNAALRRGRPTLHLAFGEDVAVLTAIALLSRAFGVVAGLQTVAPEVRSDLVVTLTAAIGSEGLVKGQLQDLRDGARPRTAAEIAETNQLKTGALFAALLGMAGRLAGTGTAQLACLHRLADALGQAFQLHDDLHDRDPASGKSTGLDQGKSTLLAMCGEREVRQRLEAHLQHVEQCLANLALADSPICTAMRRVFARSPGQAGGTTGAWCQNRLDASAGGAFTQHV